MAHFYILYSEHLDKYYVGHTESWVEQRLEKHLQKHKGFTGTATDWQVMYTEEYSTKEEAYTRERQVKRWKSRKKIEAFIYEL